MELFAVIAMNAGLAVQNLSEWRSGGPHPPPWVTKKLSKNVLTAAVKARALLLVSLLVAALSMTGLVFGLGWVTILLATGLAANALFQCLASVVLGKVLPGTWAGLLFMLPPSLWVLFEVDSGLGWAAFIIGPALSVPTLISVWAIALNISRQKP